MTARAVEPWAVAPVDAFVHEVQARLVLVMTPAGQVLAQWGFARAVDVMSAAALAADLQEASPKEPATKQVLAADFERELADSLNALFGR